MFNWNFKFNGDFLYQVATFSQFQAHLNVIEAEQMISLLLLNNLIIPSDIISTSSREKESDELLYTVRSLVMVRELVASARNSQCMIHVSILMEQIQLCGRSLFNGKSTAIKNVKLQIGHLATSQIGCLSIKFIVASKFPETVGTLLDKLYEKVKQNLEERYYPVLMLVIGNGSRKFVESRPLTAWD